MSNDRNKTLDSKAAKILTLVHCDLAGPIQPLAKDGYKYILNFIDDYFGLTVLYFLKHKSNTLLTATKYLADITPYGHVKWDCWMVMANFIFYGKVSPYWVKIA